MTFLEKLDYLKGREKLNNNTLSQKTGIPYTTIDSFYKKGYKNMKFETLEKLSRFFNVSLDYLMNDDITDEKYGINSDEVNNVFKYLQYESGERTVRLDSIEVRLIDAFREASDNARASALMILGLSQEAFNIQKNLEEKTS